MIMLKGSFTVEAKVVVVIFLCVIALTMNMAIQLNSEIKSAHEEQTREDMWLVDDFYRYQIIEGIRND